MIEMVKKRSWHREYDGTVLDLSYNRPLALAFDAVPFFIECRVMNASSDEQFLKALAIAIVHRPRANLYELASAVGVSKATLYRTAKTREQLVDKVRDHCVHLIKRLIEEARLQTDPPLVALRQLTENFVAHREFNSFLFYHWQPTEGDFRDAGIWAEHEALLDSFFLRGQKAGVFRMDVTAACLSDCFCSMTGGLAESEMRGRIARATLPDVIEMLFVNGAIAPVQG